MRSHTRNYQEKNPAFDPRYFRFRINGWAYFGRIQWLFNRSQSQYFQVIWRSQLLLLLLLLLVVVVVVVVVVILVVVVNYWWPLDWRTSMALSVKFLFWAGTLSKIIMAFLPQGYVIKWKLMMVMKSYSAFPILHNCIWNVLYKQSIYGWDWTSAYSYFNSHCRNKASSLQDKTEGKYGILMN